MERERESREIQGETECYPHLHAQSTAVAIEVALVAPLQVASPSRIAYHHFGLEVVYGASHEALHVVTDALAWEKWGAS